MMRFPPRTRLLPLCALGLACGPSERVVPTVSVRDSAGIRIVENRPESSADTCAFTPRPQVSIGTVEGASEYQLYRVMDATRLSDGRIAIVNQGSDEVRLYDSSGRYLGAFGREGGGPGEFRNVFQIWSPADDTLLVGDYRPWRFSYFTAAGEYLRSIEPEPLYINSPEVIGVMADGTFVLGSHSSPTEPEGFKERWLYLVHHGQDGLTLDTIGSYSRGRWGYLSREYRFVGTPLFEPMASAVAGGERIVVGTGTDRELLALDQDGETGMIVRWTGPDRAVTSEDVEAYRKETLEQYDNPEARRRFGEPQVSDERPVNDRFPAHGTVLLGEAGDIWVREYSRPSWPEDRKGSWLVFQADGRFLCHARTPPAVRNAWDLFEIGPDYALAEATDETDVEYVHLYGLSRPRGHLASGPPPDDRD